MSFRLWLANAISPPAPYSPVQCEVFPEVMRAPGWRAVRNEWLRQHPACEACGNSFQGFLQVHHVIPIHVDQSRELDTANLITLCINGPGGLNCHYAIGHCFHWKDWNMNVWGDAARFSRMLRGRCLG